MGHEIIELCWDYTVASMGGNQYSAFANLGKNERIVLFEIWSASEKMDIDTIMVMYETMTAKMNTSSIPKEFIKKYVAMALLEKGHSKEHSIVKRVALPIKLIDWWRAVRSNGNLELELTVRYKLETNESHIKIRDTRERK